MDLGGLPKPVRSALARLGLRPIGTARPLRLRFSAASEHEMGARHKGGLRVLTLLARHGIEKYNDALPRLDAYYQSKMPDVARRLVIIDNAEPPDLACELTDSALMIGASNEAWEFSAWDAGMQRCSPELLRYDYVHLVTSAYWQLYTKYIDRIDADMLQAIRGRDVALGHIDAYNEPVELLGRSSQSWLRSSFIFVPTASLRRLGAITSLLDGAQWFSNDPEAPFLAEAPLDERFRANIIGWLTGSGTGQDTEWHSRFGLNDETLPFFKAKALAILNEHALSVRLRAQGTATVDATWLYSLLQQKSGQIGAIPHPREQLESRKPYL